MVCVNCCSEDEKGIVCWELGESEVCPKCNDWLAVEDEIDPDIVDFPLFPDEIDVIKE